MHHSFLQIKKPTSWLYQSLYCPPSVACGHMLCVFPLLPTLSCARFNSRMIRGAQTITVQRHKLGNFTNAVSSSTSQHLNNPTAICISRAPAFNSNRIFVTSSSVGAQQQNQLQLCLPHHHQPGGLTAVAAHGGRVDDDGCVVSSLNQLVDPSGARRFHLVTRGASGQTGHDVRSSKRKQDLMTCEWPY